MFASPTIIGEAFVGAGAEAAHLNVVLGRLGSPVETAWVSSLAAPRAGHVPFMTVLQPGLPVKPLTLFVNKAAIEGERHGILTWGAAQAGVAAGVAAAVAEGLIPAAEVDVAAVHRRGLGGARRAGRGGRLSPTTGPPRWARCAPR